MFTVGSVATPSESPGTHPHSVRRPPMRYRLILGALAAFAVTACADAVVQPQPAEEIQVRKMAIDEPQPIDQPCVDVCEPDPDPCAYGCYTPEPIPPFDPP